MIVRFSNNIARFAQAATVVQLPLPLFCLKDQLLLKHNFPTEGYIRMSTTKDLVEHIDFSNLECLNEQPSHPASNVLKQGYREDDGLFLESDTDEQLLLNIHFNQKVRIHSITVTGPEEDGPKMVKLYTNRMSLGFSDADSVPVAQQLELTPKQLAGEPIALKLTKFNSVTILSILIDSNQSDADTTKVYKIAFAGVAGDTFNVAEIKKQEEGS